jgi:hypothetical protein
MSPSGLVIIRCVSPLPGPVDPVFTMLAPTKRSLAFLVITAPLVVVALLPVESTTTSIGLPGSIPLYSKIRMSG